jgi:uncharacterized protein (DUF1697 family)
MPSYIAFLRAVNVGGRVLKMADLRTCLEEAGLQDVETYIQTGNVRFTSAMRSLDKVERSVEEALADHCGFEVPAIAFSPRELSNLHDDAMRLPSPFGKSSGHGRYVIFFKQADVPSAEIVEQMAAWDQPGESAAVIDRAVHVWLDHPTMQAEFFGAFKKALFPGTNRNLKVVSTLAERWGS